MIFYSCICPLIFGKKEIEIIDNSTDKLGDLLFNIQKNYVFAFPEIYTKQDDTEFQMISIKSNTSYNFPLHPDISKISNIVIHIDNADYVIKFDDFINNIDEFEEINTSRIHLNITKEKSEKLIKKFGIK